jgi:hypothetical protein
MCPKKHVTECRALQARDIFCAICNTVYAKTRCLKLWIYTYKPKRTPVNAYPFQGRKHTDEWRKIRSEQMKKLRALRRTNWGKRGKNKSHQPQPPQQIIINNNE